MTANPARASLEQPVHQMALRKVYRDLLADLEQAPGKLRAFLYGGRSMGKSVLLGILAGSVHNDDRPFLFIECKSGHDTIQRIDELAEAIRGGEGPPDLYLDDVDHLLSRILRIESRGTAERILRNLNFLLSKVPAAKGRFFLSSAPSPSRLSELLYSLRRPELDVGLLRDFFSFVLEQKFECMRLDPWSYRWEKRVEELVRLCLPKVQPPYLEVCCSSILDLTGGHPALLIRSLYELHRLAAEADLNPVEQHLARALGALPELPLQRFAPLFEQHIEDVLVQTGLQPLRLSISNLSIANGPDFKEAWESLVGLAQGAREIPKLRAREILLDEGLIYKSKESGAYGVPGRLVLREILSGTASGSHHPVLALEPNPETPNVLGNLVVHSGLRGEAIELTESMWSLATLFFNDPDRIFSPDELQKLTGLPSDAAVRSAIQRLITKLRANGLESVIENVYGRGYRKGHEPRFQQR